MEKEHFNDEIFYESDEASIAEYEKYNPTRKVITPEIGNEVIKLMLVNEGNAIIKELIIGPVAVPIEEQNEDEINKKIVEEILPPEILSKFVTNSIHLSHLVRHAINSPNSDPKEFLVLTGIPTE